VDNFILLTKDTGAIVGPIAKILGYVIDFIYDLLSKANIYNVGLAIILFTLLIKLCLLPLTIKQQKFSKMSAIMNPEIQAIQKKYNNKRDQDSMIKMQEETKAVYAKYGVSPSGSCLQLLIQMPILLALYRVIMKIPAYISQIKVYYEEIVAVVRANGLVGKVDEIYNADATMLKGFDVATTTELTAEQTNSVIDLLSTFTSEKWNQLVEVVTNAGGDATTVQAAIDHINDANSFLGINLAQTPSSAMGLALLIPVLAGVTQFLSVKISNATANQNNKKDENPMAGSMKMMTYMMPIMSVFFCFTFQAGIGLYWVIGAVYQIIFQLAVNLYFKKADMNAMIQKNVDKANKKRAKQGLPPQKIASNAQINTKYSEAVKEAQAKAQADSESKRKEEMKKSTDYYNKNVSKPGSLASKANMVQRYNEKNSKK